MGAVEGQLGSLRGHLGPLRAIESHSTVKAVLLASLIESGLIYLRTNVTRLVPESNNVGDWGSDVEHLTKRGDEWL